MSRVLMVEVAAKSSLFLGSGGFLAWYVSAKISVLPWGACWF